VHLVFAWWRNLLTQPRTNRRIAVSLVAVLAVALTGCPNRTRDTDVMAKVSGYKITRAEVDKTFNEQIAGTQQKLSPEQDQMLRLQILQQLIGLRLYLQKAEKLGIVATDEDVDNRVNQAKALSTREEFEKKLQEMGVTESDYRQEIRKNLTIEKLLNKEIASKVTISDADLQNYYNEHKSQFNVIEPQYRLAHIFVSSQPNAPSGPIADKAQNDAQAREKIKMIYNRLASGEDFATVAAKYSEDTDTARSGGELGATPESQLRGTDPATRDAIAKLKPGQFSEIIPITNPTTQKPLGYRIVKLIGKEPAGQRDYNDPNVQQMIRTQLLNQREELLKEAYRENLHDSAEIHNYYAEQILKSANAQK